MVGFKQLVSVNFQGTVILFGSFAIKGGFPLEAHQLKRRIEKQEQQVKAYYDQFSVNRYRVNGSRESVKDKLAENISNDFAGGRKERSIYCNYVWSAGGGLHKEEHSVANIGQAGSLAAGDAELSVGLDFRSKLTNRSSVI